MQSKKALCKEGGRKIVASSATQADESVEEFKAAILRHLRLTLARHLRSATKHELWTATSLAVRDYVIDRFISTQRTHNAQDVRRVYYLSLEYLMGRLLNSNLHNSGLHETATLALAQLGHDLDDVSEAEHDMGLGNGGLGRLAACFLDSLATLDLPAIGYGIHYQFGLFRQVFENGHQLEKPDDWLKYGNPWEIVRPQYSQTVHLYGRVEAAFDTFGNYSPRWVDTKSIEGVPYDVPIVGYGTRTVNFLRLWESKSSQEFDLETFNEGGYVEAVREKAVGEILNICSGIGVTVREVVQLLLQALEVTNDVQFGALPERTSGADKLTGDWSKARSILGWHPKTGLTDGISATIDSINVAM